MFSQPLGAEKSKTSPEEHIPVSTITHLLNLRNPIIRFYSYHPVKSTLRFESPAVFAEAFLQDLFLKTAKFNQNKSQKTVDLKEEL